MISDLLTGLLGTGCAMLVLIAAMIGLGMCQPELTRRWPGRLRGCLAWEPEMPHGHRADSRPRRFTASSPRNAVAVLRLAWAIRRGMRVRARGAAATSRPGLPVNGRSLGTQPRRQRPGKQPWETAGQPRLPEMMP